MTSIIKDPQFTPVYNQQFFQYLLSQEYKFLVSNNYMNEQQQPDLNARMRSILADWLVDVHLNFKLRDETFYITLHLIDRFVNIQKTTRQQLQLVGYASLFLACKYEEIYPPDLKDFVYITDIAYTKSDVLDMEGQILQALDFSITQPSIYCFLQRFRRVAGLDTEIYFQLNTYQNYRQKTPQSWNEEMNQDIVQRNCV
ncbi:unnamed protein product [Paramecium octaurelia]|uniref:Cyclin-like domain-containing protein n=1 Tax=Paramecium octaurelia TaxID=43137 RepID=A0A8S1S3X2_PAROT|nr:unnamed protein product [Paramecium octaurelia]